MDDDQAQLYKNYLEALEARAADARNTIKALKDLEKEIELYRRREQHLRQIIEEGKAAEQQIEGVATSLREAESRKAALLKAYPL
jgi:hypothetical protein